MRNLEVVNALLQAPVVDVKLREKVSEILSCRFSCVLFVFLALCVHLFLLAFLTPELFILLISSI